MRYKIFVINIIIEPKNVCENSITYSGISRWYSNKVRCKKKSTLTRIEEVPCYNIETKFAENHHFLL